MIDLPAHDLAEVLRIVRTHAPDCEIRVFGSRVQGSSRLYSDLDLALVAPCGQIPASQLTALKDAFAESNLAFQVDVLDWHAISPRFRKEIEDNHEVL